MGRWLWLLLLLAMPLVGQAAIVPDASVVQTDPDAPRLPPDTAPRSRPPVASTPAPQATSAPRPRPTPSASKAPRPVPAAASAGQDGRAFGDREAAQAPGDTRALLPLAPTPISRASSMPLWISVVVFLIIALAGSWLAQQRSGE
jgi:hypothetical protein